MPVAVFILNYDHQFTKDFGLSIKLTSFVLKTLERVLNIHLRTIMKRTSFSKSQRNYFKDKSTETGLHEVVSMGDLLDKASRQLRTTPTDYAIHKPNFTSILL